MAGKKKLKTEDKWQSRRFIETAKRLQSDESGVKFKRVLQKLAPVKKPHKNS